MKNNFEELIIELYAKLKSLKFKNNKIVVLDRYLDTTTNTFYNLQKNIYQKDEEVFKLIDIISPSLDNHLKLLKTYKTLDFTDKEITLDIIDPEKTIVNISDSSAEIFSNKIVINNQEYNKIYLSFNFESYNNTTFKDVSNIRSNTFEENLIPSAYISVFENKFNITHQPTYNTKQVINISIKVIDYLDNISVDDYISGILKIRLNDAIILVNNVEVNNKIKLDIGTLNSSLIKVLNFNLTITRHKNYSNYDDLIYCLVPLNK